MKRIASILILAAMTAQLPAQEAWPLDRCIQYALEHNLGIREKNAEIGIRQAELTQRQLAHLPVFSAQIVQDFNWGRSVDMQELVIIRNALTHATGASINVSLPLFDGLTRHNQRRSAQKAVEVAMLDAEDLRTSLETDITRAYLELMLAKQMLAYTRESHATIVQQRDRTARLVDAGSQPKSSLGEMEAQVASEKAEMVTAECRVRTATLSLTRLMNLPPDTPFTTGDLFGQDSVAARVTFVSDAQAEAWLLRDPRLRSAQARIRQMQLERNAAKGGFLPSLGLSAGYGTYYSSTAEEPFKTQMEENRNPSLSLHLTIPIFDAWQAATRLKKSDWALEMARISADRMRIEILDEIRSAGIEAENCFQRYLSSQETLQAMQSLLEITEAKYNLGAATALDYIIARNNRFKAVSDFLQAKWQYLFQLKLLERYQP
jgi:outer membrane protein